MLDNFLENTIKKKLYLYHILQASQSISVFEVSDLLKTNIMGVTNLVNELNQNFHGFAKIKKNQHMLSISVSDATNLLKPLHMIYANSTILQCLKFMITNDTAQPFYDFMDTYFLSKSTAYRTREVCCQYLNCIGLGIKNNKVVGEEYRIRFLIGLLYYKYGIDCCGIDADSIRLARKFILSTNQVIDLNYLEKTVNEYGYFECLLILSWKRKGYPVSFVQHDSLNALKKLFVYQDMMLHFQQVVEPELALSFTTEDYEYIFAVYCCTNSCVLADKWTKESIRLVREIIFSHKIYQDLIRRFENKFHLDVQSNSILHTMFVYFFKKFILQLQCIIPDKHFYLDAIRKPTLLKVVHSVEEVTDAWRKENNLKYPIDPNHIRCLSIQLETILRQCVQPVQVVIISDLIVEIKITELVLTRKFSAKQIQITKLLLNAQKMDFLYDIKNAVIVVNHRLSNYINHLGISEENTILSLSAEINAYDIQAIQDAVEYYDKKAFLKTQQEIV